MDATVEAVLGARFRQILGATPWLVVTDVDQSAVGVAATLQRLGAVDVLALGVSRGTGPIDDDVELISLGVSTVGSMMDGIRHAQHVAENLPDHVRSRLDEWDPSRSARVMVPFTFHAFDIDGRQTWGARPAAWEQLEDKLVADSIWAAAGIAHAPSRAAALDDRDALVSAHRAVASSQGSVWAVDATAGWHGGGSGVRWVSNEADIDAVVSEWSETHERVRIMPFLDGVPCSIHGLVIGSDVAVMRPCEMIVLRDRDRRRFVYAAASTFWDPTPEERVEMRRAARAVGAVLRADHDFRGAFTIDGVLTVDGFRPTELNARFGAALALVGRARPDLPIFVTHCAAVAGDLDDLDVGAFERWAVSAADADANRQARSMFTTDRSPESGEETVAFVLGADGDVVPTEPDDDDAVAVAVWGPSATGGVVLVDYHRGVPIGPPTALLTARIARSVDERWDLGLGALEPAPVVPPKVS